MSWLKHFSEYTSKLKCAKLQINVKSQSCRVYSSSCLWNDRLLFPACSPNCSLKQNWMRLHRVDENDTTEEILYMKRRRKFTTESKKDEKSQINNSLVGLHTVLCPFFLFPFIFLCWVHCYWHLRDFSLSLLLVLIPTFLPDSFVQKALYVGSHSVFTASGWKNKSSS